MPRREAPLPAETPTDVRDMAQVLRTWRSEAGLTYEKLAQRTGYSPSTLLAAASGRRVPADDVARTIIRACGGDDTEADAFVRRLGALRADPTVKAWQGNRLSRIRHQSSPLVNAAATAETWDVFISHASEDKAAVATPLASRLRALGLTVWLDDAELRIGDSLRRKIDAGLVNSRFGVVILSKAFFAKDWPQYELDGIVSRSAAGVQNLLPIWHKIDRDEILEISPTLADKIARRTDVFTVNEIAAEIAEVVLEARGPS